MSSYITSSIGRKQLMGLSGLIWAGFVFGHMAGNMLILVGPEAYNHYANAIATNPILLYSTEVLLLAMLIPHVINGLWLWLENRRAAHGWKKTNGKKAPRWNSRWMAFHGSIILVFIITHLATFKYGTTYTTQLNGVEVRDIYKLVVEVFHQPGFVLWYLVALVLLGFHLSHGFYSSFASLGIWHPKYSPWLNCIGYVYSIVVVLGFVSQPVYVYFFAP